MNNHELCRRLQISSLFNLKAPKGNIARNLEDEADTSSWNPAKLITESKSEKVSIKLNLNIKNVESTESREITRTLSFQIQDLIEQAYDENLPNRLIERIDGTDSACTRLLVCKISPVITAAQSFLKNEDRVQPRRLTAWLPSRDEFEKNSDGCENTHTDCSLFS